MRKGFYSVGLYLQLFVIIMTCVTWAQCASKSGNSAFKAEKRQPRIQFLNVNKDLGDLYQDTNVSHSFEFKNAGTGVLTIRDIHTHCGCVVTKLSKERLAPGESGSIEFTFFTGSYKGKLPQKIVVDTNDPTQKSVILTFTCTVKVAAEVTPSGVYGGRIKTGETVRKEVLVKPLSPAGLALVGSETKDPAVKVIDIQKVDEKEGTGQYRVTIQFGPVAKPGNINTNIILTTNSQIVKTLKIPAYAKVIAQRN